MCSTVQSMLAGTYRQSQLGLQGFFGQRLALIHSVSIILDVQELVHIGAPVSRVHAIHYALHPSCLPATTLRLCYCYSNICAVCRASELGSTVSELYTVQG